MTDICISSIIPQCVEPAPEIQSSKNKMIASEVEVLHEPYKIHMYGAGEVGVQWVGCGPWDRFAPEFETETDLVKSYAGSWGSHHNWLVQ